MPMPTSPTIPSMEDVQPPIFTIGYGNYSADAIIGRLERYRVEFLVDVRSQPYSSHSPEFSKGALEALLKKRGIRYVFMGDVIGGRPSDPTCYVDGKVDYGLVEQRSWYRDGIKRLQDASEQHCCLALLCSEIDPERCHRSKLIGCSLDRLGIAVQHIDRDGNLAPQEQVIARLTGGQKPLFGAETFTSNAKYL